MDMYITSLVVDQPALPCNLKNSFRFSAADCTILCFDLHTQKLTILYFLFRNLKQFMSILLALEVNNCRMMWNKEIYNCHLFKREYMYVFTPVSSWFYKFTAFSLTKLKQAIRCCFLLFFFCFLNFDFKIIKLSSQQSRAWSDCMDLQADLTQY
jgi:hypothetical protein